jgi:hypothetical protein
MVNVRGSLPDLSAVVQADESGRGDRTQKSQEDLVVLVLGTAPMHCFTLVLRPGERCIQDKD